MEGLIFGILRYIKPRVPGKEFIKIAFWSDSVDWFDAS